MKKDRMLRPLWALTLTVIAASCAVNPATGRREFSLVSESQELRMGREADPQIVASMGLYDDPELSAYVERLGNELAAVSERPNLDWTFRVLDDPTVNAFALPGYIYVTRGILSHLESEAQLAGVLGHEIGHVTARHSANQLSNAQLGQVLLGGTMIFVPEARAFGGLLDTGFQLLTLKFGRDDEKQADELGVRYMTGIRYDPRELAEVMALLGRASAIHQEGGRVPSWLSTHPDPENRVENIREQVASLPVDVSSYTVAEASYLDRLDGMVFGEDPREGYFEGDVFYHPELRFRLDFPSGWQHVNTKQAVQSLAPDQDAAFVLTLEELDPAGAMASFRSQDGVRAGEATERRSNGLTGLYAGFTARSQEGNLSGLVGFVSYGGDTYRLLGFAPASRWERHAAVLEAAALSLAPENRSEYVDVDPARLEIVRLDRPMSIEDFMERYPSTVAPEIVQLINHVAPGDPLPAGRAKRVVGGR